PAPARIGRDAARQARAGGRRRRAQHLRPVQRARTARDGSHHRRHRPGSDREGRRRRRHRPGADGHHDAGHGRLRHHARHPRGPRLEGVADRGTEREGDEGRPREMPRGGRIRLPGQAGRHRPAPGGAAAMAAPVNILLVDDQPGRLMTYRAILEPLGERLVEASSGDEALRLLMEDEYAVILLDVNMPGMDGFETASLVHQHPRFEKTPIIFVTAVNVTDMDRLRGYKLGAVDYVMVPVIPEILRSKVVVLAELFRKRRELQEANAALEAEKARELDRLNASLRAANAELAARNQDLRNEIAERGRAEQRLREADRRKDEFLATLAHELRNPLAPLLNAINIRRLSKAGEDDPMQGLMERQLALLVRLIDDLLDVARITRGKLELRRE